MSETVSRREVLALFGAALIGGMLPAPLGAYAPRGSGHQLEAELDAWLSTRLGDADVKAIAAAWRAAHPAEASAEGVARAILAKRRGGEPLARYLARTVASEHGEGRAERMDGWYLAPTEARLATLLDLVRGGTASR